MFCFRDRHMETAVRRPLVLAAFLLLCGVLCPALAANESADEGWDREAEIAEIQAMIEAEGMHWIAAPTSTELMAFRGGTVGELQMIHVPEPSTLTLMFVAASTGIAASFARRSTKKKARRWR